jgi:ribonuclease HI
LRKGAPASGSSATLPHRTPARRSGPATSALILYFDGASRGNPGPAAYGVWSPSGLQEARALGRTTNNVAEWRGFLAALDLALGSGAEEIEIRADSQLVLRQFSGEYRMKAPHLAAYLAEARWKARNLPRLRVLHVPREANREADALANRALDEAASRAREGRRGE